MFTALLCHLLSVVALGVAAASAVYGTKAMRKMDLLYDDRVGQD